MRDQVSLKTPGRAACRRALRLNSLLRRGEYPCAVEVQKAHATLEVDRTSRIWRGV